tara:strand:+ start:239 stop:856 length:618 start_codon:yes stop_codon:yes gene_type:complete
MEEKDSKEKEEVKKIDPGDYKVLLHAILKQAMDDYIKLQHPKFRTKKYLQEAFDSAVDLLFNSDYRMLHIQNDMGEMMSLKDMVTSLMEDDRADLEDLKKHVIQEARAFWETKLVRTLYIPESFIYDGHVYSVFHTDDFDPSVDFDKKEITINKLRGSESEQQFLTTAIDIVFYHEDIPAKKETRSKLSKGLFRMLKVNSCFTGS